LKHALAYYAKDLDQDGIYEELYKFGTWGNLMFNDFKENCFASEKLNELLFVASADTLDRLLHANIEHKPYAMLTPTLKVHFLSALYPKDKHIPFRTHYPLFNKTVWTFQLLKFFCSISFYRHRMTTRMRRHINQWINDQDSGNDEGLCHTLIEMYNYEHMPMHQIIRIAHCKGRNATISAMFAWLTNNCGADQFSLLPSSVQERIRRIENEH